MESVDINESVVATETIDNKTDNFLKQKLGGVAGRFTNNLIVDTGATIIAGTLVDIASQAAFNQQAYSLEGLFALGIGAGVLQSVGEVGMAAKNKLTARFRKQ